MTSPEGQKGLSDLLLHPYPSPQHRKDTLMLYGEHLLGALPLDVIELTAQRVPVGVAYVLPYTRHTDLFHGWPEVFHIELLESVQDSNVQEQLLVYLYTLSQQHPFLFQQVLQLHGNALKQRAVEDEQVYRLLIHHFVFETPLGRITLDEHFKHSGHLRYITDPHQYQQIQRVAAAQQHLILNAAFDQDAALLARYHLFYPESSVDALDAGQYADLLPAIEVTGNWLETAQSLLAPHLVQVEVRHFQPAHLPALLVASEAHLKFRHQNPARTSPVVQAMVKELMSQGQLPAMRLVLNHAHPLVQELTLIQDQAVLEEVLKMIYLQARMLGNLPMGETELQMASGGLQQLLVWGLQATRFRDVN